MVSTENAEIMASGDDLIERLEGEIEQLNILKDEIMENPNISPDDREMDLKKLDFKIKGLITQLVEVENAVCGSMAELIK